MQRKDTKEESPEVKQQPVESLTGQPPVNSEAANKQSEETLTNTKQELNQTALNIKDALDANTITREEAKSKIEEKLSQFKSEASKEWDRAMYGRIANRAKRLIVYQYLTKK